MSRDNDRWIAELRDRQESALSDLREALLRNLRRAFADRSVDDPLLEDAVQDALLRILDRLHQFEGRSRFLTWATSIAIHIAMKELRRRRWKDVSLNDLLTDAESGLGRAIDPQAAPENRAQRRAILESMHQIIDGKLTERQRTALTAELKGMPQEEIARQLGSTRNAVYKLTHDARRKLKQGLLAAGYTPDDIVSTISSSQSAAFRK